MKRILIFILIICVNSFSTNGQLNKGIASYYAKKFEGRRCASGEIFRHDSLTCAHKTLPFGTKLKVCNSKNKCVIVKVNDRLPKKSKRTIDLTMRAAKEIDLYYAGLMKITIEVVGKDSIRVSPRRVINQKHISKKKTNKKK